MSLTPVSSMPGFIDNWLTQTEDSPKVHPHPHPHSQPHSSSSSVLKRRRSSSLPSKFQTFKPAQSLTRRALRQFNRILDNSQDMAQTILPPQNESAETSITSAPGLLGQSPSETLPSIPVNKDPASVQLALGMHGLYQNDDEALQRYPDFERKMRGILNKSCLPVMKKEQWNEYQKVHRLVKHLNERTVLHNLVPRIIRTEYVIENHMLPHEKLERFRKLRDSLPEEDLLKALEDLTLHTNRQRTDDNLLVTMDSELARSLLPSGYLSLGFSKYLAKALAKDHSMSNPRPDYTYGLAPGVFTPPIGVMLAGYIISLLNVSPGLRHPFMILEGKSNRGDIGDAENQVCRGGAALLRASRMLWELVGDSNLKGPDEKSAIFSVVMSPNAVEIWLHWVEGLENGNPKYHMNSLDSRLLNKENNFNELQTMLHNIMRWGCLDRPVLYLNELHTKLHEYQRTETQKQLAEDKQNKKRKLNSSTPSS